MYLPVVGIQNEAIDVVTVEGRFHIQLLIRGKLFRLLMSFGT